MYNLKKTLISACQIYGCEVSSPQNYNDAEITSACLLWETANKLSYFSHLWRHGDDMMTRGTDEIAAWS